MISFLSLCMLILIAFSPVSQFLRAAHRLFFRPKNGMLMPATDGSKICIYSVHRRRYRFVIYTKRTLAFRQHRTLCTEFAAATFIFCAMPKISFAQKQAGALEHQCLTSSQDAVVCPMSTCLGRKCQSLMNLFQN